MVGPDNISTRTATKKKRTVKKTTFMRITLNTEDSSVGNISKASVVCADTPF